MFIIRSAHPFTKLPTISSCSFKYLFRPSLTFINSGSFGSSKWNRKEFIKKLDKEIIDSHAQIIWQDRETEAYFAKQHWSIKYIQEKTQFQYTKIKGQHEVRILTHVMYAPPNDPDYAEQRAKQPKEKNKQNQKAQYCQVGIFIRKKGGPKWLAVEVAVLEGSIQLMGVFFTLRPDFSWEKDTYPGPELKALPEELIEGINSFLMELGLTPQLIMNMVIHASIKVDPLDLEWLKNLRQIWT